MQVNNVSHCPGWTPKIQPNFKKIECIGDPPISVLISTYVCDHSVRCAWALTSELCDIIKGVVECDILMADEGRAPYVRARVCVCDMLYRQYKF